MPLVNKMEGQQCQTYNGQVIQHKASEGGNSSVNEETLLNIIKSIKNLESLLNNMKSSVIAGVESKHQDMKTSLVCALDAKMYVEAVHKPAIIIDSSCTDEG